MDEPPVHKPTWGSRQVSPLEPVDASRDDHERIMRFPHGYPHVVSFADDDGATLYALRMRKLDGSFEIIGDATSDLEWAQEDVRQMYLILAREPDFGTDEDGRLTWSLVRKLYPKANFSRPYVMGVEDSVWPHLQSADRYGDFFHSLPEGCPLIVVDETRDLPRYNPYYKKNNALYSYDIHVDYYNSALRVVQYMSLYRLYKWELEIFRPPLPPEFKIRT